MATPNMATITASLERSLHNCSLNNQHSTTSSSSSSGGGGEAARGPDSPAATPTLELNSQTSLPFHWEQCLDLKTGEIYYINWRTGMKAKEDPRTTVEYDGGDYYSEGDDNDNDNDDSSSYDSEGSYTESSPSSSREQWSGGNANNQESYGYSQEKENNSSSSSSNNNNNYDNANNNSNNNNNNNVLVVAGCKSCLMYYMVPKQLEVCPKCCGQLLHFDRSENGSS